MFCCSGSCYFNVSVVHVNLITPATSALFYKPESELSPESLNPQTSKSKLGQAEFRLRLILKDFKRFNRFSSSTRQQLYSRNKVSKSKSMLGNKISDWSKGGPRNDDGYF